MSSTAASSEPVNIRLLDREFLVACSDEERPGLIAAAALLDSRMRELRGKVANPGFDRLAVLVALSVTHEFLSLEKKCELQEQVIGGSIEQLRRKLEATLSGA
ncbi:MAG TPA: cell division protein ZapA [Rhodanobacteraceae bacterium]|nr:cell division protein ZapA [Rhodanobacteraceae bacterium]